MKRSPCILFISRADEEKTGEGYQHKCNLAKKRKNVCFPTIHLKKMWYTRVKKGMYVRNYRQSKQVRTLSVDK